MIPKYCNALPALAVENTMSPIAGFSQQIGSRVSLQCGNGYRPQHVDSIAVICESNTPEVGWWHPNGDCEGIRNRYLDSISLMMMR